jgi:hypothetical protein
MQSLCSCDSVADSLPATDLIRRAGEHEVGAIISRMCGNPQTDIEAHSMQPTQRADSSRSAAGPSHVRADAPARQDESVLGRLKPRRETTPQDDIEQQMNAFSFGKPSHAPRRFGVLSDAALGVAKQVPGLPGALHDHQGSVQRNARLTRSAIAEDYRQDLDAARRKNSAHDAWLFDPTTDNDPAP